jgi:NarL family two-component system response regulator LiaR
LGQIRILLVDDHQIVREGTRQLLEQAPDLLVVGEAADGLEAVRLAALLCPDVILMDVRLPGLGGLEATQAIHQQQPHIRVLILSAYDDDQYVFPLMQAGASGYLLKTASGAELADSIRAVRAGLSVLDRRIARKLSPTSAGATIYRRDEQAEPLTERELEVLRAAALGGGNKSIGEALSISPQTVQVHLRNIFGKLGVNSRAEAVACALRHGWVKIEPERA